MRRHYFVSTASIIIPICLLAFGYAQDNRQGDEKQAVGRLIRIPLPLTGSGDLRVQRMVDQIVAGLSEDGPQPIVVFEFWTDNDEAPPSDFGRAIELAGYLTSKQVRRVRTVAYIPEKKIQGHAVLAVLACQEIVMHPKGQLGDAGILETADGGGVPPHVLAAYREIANRRRTIPEAVALGMLDPSIQVHRLGDRYVTKDELPVADADNPLIPAGEMGNFTGAELREVHRFVSRLASDHQELAQELGIAPEQLEIDPSLGGEWKPVLIDLQGPMNPAAVGRITRMIDEQLKRATNLICLRIDSPGGSPESSILLANYLEESIDSSQVRTVAYIPSQALADASIVAAACDHIVAHEDAQLGGAGAYAMNRDELDVATDAVKLITAAKRRSWSLPVALLDPDLVVHEYKLDGSDVKAYFAEDELKDQDDQKRWVRGREVTTPGSQLMLSGQQAVEMGLAREAVSDETDLMRVYHLEAAPELVRPNWASELIHKLAKPQVAGVLLFIGGFALIAELSAPGIGVGGFVSAVCFLLFFWSQFFNGTAGWLEILLFFAGIVFMLIEVLVIPGFGVFGLGGGAMVIASLVLASQTFVWPQNDYQMQQMSKSLMVVAGAGAGVFCSMVLLRKHLKNLPFLSRIMLDPPAEEDWEERYQRESIANFDHLLDQVGVATTQLTPSGKARIAGQLLDVISSGQVVERNSLIRVVEVAGNRVVVQPEGSA